MFIHKQKQIGWWRAQRVVWEESQKPQPESQKTDPEDKAALANPRDKLELKLNGVEGLPMSRADSFEDSVRKLDEVAKNVKEGTLRPKDEQMKHMEALRKEMFPEELKQPEILKTQSSEKTEETSEIAAEPKTEEKAPEKPTGSMLDKFIEAMTKLGELIAGAMFGYKAGMEKAEAKRREAEAKNKPPEVPKPVAPEKPVEIPKEQKAFKLERNPLAGKDALDRKATEDLAKGKPISLPKSSEDQKVQSIGDGGRVASVDADKKTLVVEYTDRKIVYTNITDIQVKPGEILEGTGKIGTVNKGLSLTIQSMPVGAEAQPKPEKKAGKKAEKPKAKPETPPVKLAEPNQSTVQAPEQLQSLPNKSTASFNPAEKNYSS